MRKLLLLALLLLPSISHAQAPATITHSQVNVTISSTAVVAAAATRRAILIIQNDSDTDMYCNFAGAAAALNAGVRLNANGGSIFFDVVVPKVAVNCIHGGTGNKVALVSVDQ